MIKVPGLTLAGVLCYVTPFSLLFLCSHNKIPETYLHFLTEAGSALQRRPQRLLSNGHVGRDFCAAANQSRVGAIQELMSKEPVLPPETLHQSWRTTDRKSVGGHRK